MSGKTPTTEATSKRPPTGDFYQQKMKAWQPIMTPTWVIGTFTIVGIAFVIAGVLFVNQSNSVVEISQQYDGAGTPSTYSACQLNANDGITVKNCQIQMVAPADMAPPIYLYYQLSNFYQNHRRYVKSRNDQQLMGETVSNATLETSCDPKFISNGAVYNPCGLIAQSMFNDVFTLDSTSAYFPLKESGIAWPSDIANKFKNPSVGFGGPGYIWLHDVYPEVVSAVKSTDPNSANYNGPGVMNEHFIVWMRTAALSTFRKLYGSVNTKIPAGSTITFNVTTRFRVDEFNGAKTLVLSTTSWLGGKNPFLGYAYIGVGSLALVLAVIFILKQLISPRELGDTKFLVWKNK